VTRIIQALMTWAHARRTVVLGLAVAIAAACVLPLSRLRFDADVLHLMPRDTGAVAAFETYLETFGSLDALYVYVEAPDRGVVGDYADYVEALASALRRLPDVTRVDTGLRDERRDWSYLTDRQLLLLDDDAFAIAVARLSPDAAAERVRRTKELLALPAADVKALARRDPLGWFELSGAQLEGATGLLRVDPAGADGYVTPDGRAQLLVVHPAHPPFDTDFARRLIDAVDRAERDTRARFATQWTEDGLAPPRTDVAGGHRTAIETETLMRRESVRNTLQSLVGVLAVLYLAFRNWWLVLFGAVPILLGTVVTLALHQVAGANLSAAATGASAMLFGLGDDGLVLLFVAYRDKLARGLTPRQAVASLGPIGSSVLLGATTTAATFLGLWFMSFPSLQQLGMVIGVGILLTALFTLTVLVAGLPGASWVARSRDLRWPGLPEWVRGRRRAILVAAAIATVPLAWGLTRLQIDPRIERLRPSGPGLALETRITERFGLPRDVYLVLGEGPVLDPLLTRHERLAAALRDASGVTSVGPGLLLPSEPRQAARRAAIARVDVPAAAVADAVDQAAEAEGFVAGTFGPFRERLPRLLDAHQDLTLDAIRRHGLDDLVGRFVRQRDGQYLVATYVTADDPTAVVTVQTAVAAQAGLTLTGLPLVNASLAARLPRELTLGLAAGSAVVVLLIWLEFKRFRPTMLASLPTVLGIVWGLGALGWAGVVLDLFSVFAVLMFLGIGVDYGIHLLHPTVDGTWSIDEALTLVGPAMLLAGLTTIVGFGTLIGSAYPPLRSLGLVSVATIGTSLIASLLVLPALLLDAAPATAPALAAPEESR
jgi:predicted RND superfamily exporter protein